MTQRRPALAYLKLGSLLLLLVLAVATVRHFGGSDAFDYDRVQDRLAELGPWGPIAYIVGYAVLVILLAPGTLVTIAGAAVFGLGPTMLYVMLGAMLGATGSFGIGRALGREAVEVFLGGAKNPLLVRVRHVSEKIERNGLLVVAYLRLVYVPFGLLNYGASLTPVRFRDFALGTFVGIIPGVFVFVFMGSAVREVWQSGTPEALWNWRTPVALALFAFSFAIPLLARRFLGNVEERSA